MKKKLVVKITTIEKSGYKLAKLKEKLAVESVKIQRMAEKHVRIKRKAKKKNIKTIKFERILCGINYFIGRVILFEEFF